MRRCIEARPKGGEDRLLRLIIPESRRRQLILRISAAVLYRLGIHPPYSETLINEMLEME